VEAADEVAAGLAVSVEIADVVAAGWAVSAVGAGAVWPSDSPTRARTNTINEKKERETLNFMKAKQLLTQHF
jgi:hypothetical protein